MKDLIRATFEATECKLLGSDTGPGGFSAYVAVFGNVDRGGESIQPGAIKNLDQFIAEGWSSYDHFSTQFPVGTIKAAVQDERGLFVEVEFHSTDEAQSARKVIRERLERGKAVKCSVMYRVLADEVKDGVRVLKEIELFEAGVVNLPMNPAAAVVGAKGAEGAGAIDPPKKAGLGAHYLKFLAGQGAQETK